MVTRIILVLILFSGIAFAEKAEPLDKVVAQVNNDVITESELNAQVELLKKQLIAKKMDLPENKILRKQVLQHLIDLNLQLQLAKNNGLDIDTVELNDAIKKVATSNNMTLSQLREAVSSQGMSWKEYRQNIRKEILISQVQQKAVSKDIIVSNQQVEDHLKTVQRAKKTEQTYHLKNIVVPLSEEPTTEELKKAMTKAKEVLARVKKGEEFNANRLQDNGDLVLEGGDLGERHLAELPEIFGKAVLKMKKGDVAGPIRTGNGYQLIKLISSSENSNQPHMVTETHVRHILLKPGPSTTAAEAKKQALNLYQQLKSGKDFSQMAKQYSVDIASGRKGGDLGWVKPGELVPEFEKKMDTLALNKVSSPVKSKFGWHLIQVLGRKQIDDSDAFQKQKVRQFLQQRKFSEAIQSWQQRLRNDAYVNVIDKDLA